MDSTELLSAYLDGELSPQEIRQLERRLDEDEALRTELESLRATIRLLREHGRVSAPIALQAGLERALASEPVPSAKVVWLPRGVSLQALAVAAVALLVVGIAVSGAVQGSRQPAITSVESTQGSELPQDIAVTPDRQPGQPGQAAAESEPSVRKKGIEKPFPKAVGGGEELSTDSEPEGADAETAAKARPVADKADGEGEPALYGGGSVHTIAIRQADLPMVARLVQRHRGRDLGGSDPADRIADLGQGEHALDLRLPDTASRNAFVRDLRAAFPGRYAERVASDGGLSLSGVQVGLKIVVSPLAPPSSTEGSSASEGVETP